MMKLLGSGGQGSINCFPFLEEDKCQEPQTLEEIALHMVTKASKSRKGYKSEGPDQLLR